MLPELLDVDVDPEWSFIGRLKIKKNSDKIKCLTLSLYSVQCIFLKSLNLFILVQYT